jgi:hypothetical protein
MDRRWKDHSIKFKSPNFECVPPSAAATPLDATQGEEPTTNCLESHAATQLSRAPAVPAGQAPRRTVERANKTPAPIAGLGVLFGQSAFSSSAPSDAKQEEKLLVVRGDSSGQQEHLTDWHVQEPPDETCAASEMAPSSAALLKGEEHRYDAARTESVEEEKRGLSPTETASSSSLSSSSSSSPLPHQWRPISANVVNVLGSMLHTSSPPSTGWAIQGGAASDPSDRSPLSLSHCRIPRARQSILLTVLPCFSGAPALSPQPDADTKSLPASAVTAQQLAHSTSTALPPTPPARAPPPMPTVTQASASNTSVDTPTLDATSPPVRASPLPPKKNYMTINAPSPVEPPSRPPPSRPEERGVV